MAKYVVREGEGPRVWKGESEGGTFAGDKYKVPLSLLE
jgi:hypothetical protein